LDPSPGEREMIVKQGFEKQSAKTCPPTRRDRTWEIITTAGPTLKTVQAMESRFFWRVAIME